MAEAARRKRVAKTFMLSLCSISNVFRTWVQVVERQSILAEADSYLYVEDEVCVTVKSQSHDGYGLGLLRFTVVYQFCWRIFQR